MEVSVPEQNALRKQYDELLEARKLAVQELQIRIEGFLRSMASHPSVKIRVKDFTSYFKKYIKFLKNGVNPRKSLITDIIGMRIVCPFLEDLAVVEELLKNNFEVIEAERKGGDHTFREFGYESIHLLIKIPKELLDITGPTGCDVAEIQIRTILQDAWAEVEHELVYKAEFTPFDAPMKRKLAAVNASLSLADIIFQEIRTYQRQLNGELGKRRESFFRKIEESTDALLFQEQKPAVQEEDRRRLPPSTESIDELLLNALYAHNKNQFSEAISFYTKIFELNPDETIAALIYKHRGMAFFARSNYEEAVNDFVKSLELDPKSYKSAYYMGIVYAVLRRHYEAVEAFNKSLSINPYQPYCLFRRGQAYYHLEDFPQALADCEAALAMESFESANKFRQLLLSKLKM
ncbi:MAG: tetratricopeptide repeat protein [Treponema sp.]|jgi:putative GTP pyrophosphokinase|nr:tetratricopeptide repeat protein [Treponema sp.]